MKIAMILPTGLLRRVLGRLTLTPTGFRAQAAVAALLLLVAGGSGTKVVMDRMDALPDGAVFRASGQVVTEQQLQHRVDLMSFLYGLQQPTDAQQVDLFKRSVAKAIAVSGIVDDAARRSGIVIADKAASDQLQKMITDGTWPDRDTFLRQLGAHGLSEQDVLDEINRQQSSARLFAQVTAPVKASTDADAQRYYDQNRAEMVSPEQRDLSNIVVSAQDQAQQVAQLARAGSDIGALARQYSLDGSTKDKGGALGTVRADQLDAGYAKAAFAAPGGSVFGPVQTAQGWNVGKVTQVHPAVPLSFTDVRDAIKTKLDNDAKLKVWDDFLVQRIKAASVVYAPQYRPADPDAPPQAGT
jgi:peptidyl-prolyl cis-trans isomerase C